MEVLSIMDYSCSNQVSIRLSSYFVISIHIIGSKSGDYHDDMNHTNFMKWIPDQLIPNLPDRAVLVFDNALYHNVAVSKDPTSATQKKDKITWLV